jgi:hypothetical protein
MSGPATLACVDGTNWNGTAPHCQAKKQMSDGVINKASVKIMNMVNIVANMVIVTALSNFKL